MIRIVGRRMATIGAVVLVVAMTGCIGAGRAATLQVVVRDEALRAPGSPCAGTQPYLYIHRTAPFQIEDNDGSVLVSGALPDGVAVQVLREDLAVDRVPTNCEVTFEVRLPERETYRLVLEEGEPLTFTADDLDTNQGRLRFHVP